MNLELKDVVDSNLQMFKNQDKVIWYNMAKDNIFRNNRLTYAQQQQVMIYLTTRIFDHMFEIKDIKK